MSNQALGKRVESELKQAVANGLLPTAAHEKATKLVTRLAQPVRLALMGMPGSGKSTLMNLLVGSDVMVEGIRLPTLQLSYGETEQAICTLPDGTKQTLDTVDAATISALAPLFVDMQMPLPALAKISVLEVVAPNDPTAIQRATQWAAKRCDIALWCTRGFAEAEQQIWAPIPDLIKDHAFCMMTRADILKADGLLDAALGAVQSKAKDEFNMVLPIGTLDAIAARRPDGSVDKNMLRESGGLALISAVLRQVEQGRQSAVDMAEILLHENAEFISGDQVAAEPTPTAAPAPVVADPAPTPAAPEPVEARETAAPPPKTLDAIARLRQMAAEKSRSKPVEAEEAATKAPMPEPVDEITTDAEDELLVDELFQMPAPEPEQAAENDDVDEAEIEEAAAEAATPAPPAPAKIKTLEPSTRDAYQHVVDFIADQGQELSEQLVTLGEKGPSEVMGRAVEHIQWLCEYLNDNGDEADPSLVRARDTAFDAADMVQLMQMEKRDSAALEAVSLMLQIKRELQADLAA